MFVHFQPPRSDFLTAWITHGLRKGDELICSEPQGAVELLEIDRPAKYSRETLGSAKKVHILTDKSGINRRVETSVIRRDVLHALAMSNVDEIERGIRHEILQLSLIHISEPTRRTPI